MYICILCYCRCIALHFQLLQPVCLTDQWSIFYKTRKSCFNRQYILSSAINKKERETWKVQCGSSKWKVYYIVYEKNMDITLWVCWCQNKLFYICEKQYMHCFLPSGFINVIIFVINPSGFYSTFVGADLEYPNLLRFDRGSWSELRYFNFESSLKLWWRGAGDFDGSQILVTSEGFQGFSRRFLSFEILKLRAFLCFTIFTLISNMNC